MIDKRVLHYLIIGGRELRKAQIYDEISDILNFIDELKRMHDLELTNKQEAQLLKLILGIMKKHGCFDERYHLYLVGRLLNEANA